MTDVKEKQKKVRLRKGRVFQIPVEPGVFCYGQYSGKGKSPFFDYYDDGTNPDIKKILKSPIAFHLCFSVYAIQQGFWPVIAVIPFDSSLISSKDGFNYDPVEKAYYRWKVGGGKYKTTPEDIQDLECIAACGPNHVEQRYKGGREWEEGMGLKDSVVPDVYNKETGQAWDYKFGNAKLGQKQVKNLQKNLFKDTKTGASATIHEVKPNQ